MATKSQEHHVAPEAQDCFRKVFEFLTANAVVGDYHEYRDAGASTLALAKSEAQRSGLRGMKYWPYTDKLRDTVTPALSRKMMDTESKIAFATFASTRAESAAAAFGFADHLLQEGSVLYLETLFNAHRGSPHKGLAHAFLEYQKFTRWRFHRHLDVGWWGRTYLVYLEKTTPDGVL